MAKLPEERTFDVFVGAPRSGKSTCAKNLINAYRQNVIIVKHTANLHDATFAHLPVSTTDTYRKGIAAKEYYKCKMAFVDKDKDYPLFLSWVIKNYRNGLLVVDDATIFEQRETSAKMLELISMRAHIGVDVILIFHGFTKMPIDLFTFLNHFFVFNTTDNIIRKKDSLTDYNSILLATLKARQRYRSIEDRSNPKKYIPEILRLN